MKESSSYLRSTVQQSKVRGDSFSILFFSYHFQLRKRLIGLMFESMNSRALSGKAATSTMGVLMIIYLGQEACRDLEAAEREQTEALNAERRKTKELEKQTKVNKKVSKNVGDSDKAGITT